MAVQKRRRLVLGTASLLGNTAFAILMFNWAFSEVPGAKDWRHRPATALLVVGIVTSLMAVGGLLAVAQEWPVSLTRSLEMPPRLWILLLVAFVVLLCVLGLVL